MSTGKSFRASKESEMINYGQDLASVQGRVSSESTGLEIILTTGEVQGKKTAKKLYKINEVGKRWRDFVGNLKIVLFRPESIDIILGSPSIRRDYLNSVLEQVDWQYRVCALAYYKGLRQRNKLLDKIREGEAQKSQLVFWNQLLIKNGGVVTQKREELIEFFNSQFKNGIEIEYDRSIISEVRLEKYSQAELALGATLVGPHRDDVKLKAQSLKLKVGRELALFGSRGEQRMAVLALKLAELEFINEKTSQRPVLLLDDIFSELDKEHRSQIFKIIPKQQTIITATEVDLINKKLRDKIDIEEL